MQSDSPDSDDDRYCAELVRRYDRDRFLCSLFAADNSRRNLMALYAFNIEIAGTRETVSEPLIGQMRLKWWFDALDAIHDGTPPAHQVAVPLSRAIGRGGIDRKALENLVEARLLDLDEEPLGSMEALVDYADRTSGHLSMMALSMLGIDEREANEACRQAGIAYALTGMVRALPVNFRQRRVFLPQRLRQHCALDIDRLLDGGMKTGTPENLLAAITIVTDCAKEHLSKARKMTTSVPRQGFAALLPGVLAKGYLADLDKCGNDPFRLPLRPPGPGVKGMLQLGWAAARRRI